MLSITPSTMPSTCDFGPHKAFYRRQTHLIHQLVLILYDNYQVYGGLDLLRTSLYLVRLGLQLAIICGEDSLQPSLLTHFGHIDFALYENTADANALAESIRIYRKVQRNTKPGNRDHTDSGLGLAISRFHHMKRQGLRDERSSLLEELEQVQDQAIGGPLHAYAVAVYITITTDRYMLPPEGVTNDTKWRHLTYLEEVQDLATSIFQTITIWFVRAEMMYHIASATSDLYLMAEGIHLARLALRHISTSHPLGFQFLRFYGGLYELRGTLLDSSSDLEAAFAIAEEAVSVPGLSPGARCGALYMWAKGLVGGADRAGDLDMLERAINGLREAISLLSPQNAFQGSMAALLAQALRIHFEHSGQMPGLDHIITLCDRKEDLVQRQPQLAVNIAEAMIIRAQTVDRGRTQQLLNDAIGLLQSRMPYISTAGDATGERANADLQLVRASLMQARCGFNPALDPHTVVELARECFNLCTAIQKPTAVTNLSDALLFLSLRARDMSSLEQAEMLLESEIPYSCGSWCQAQYLAGRAGALIVRHTLTGSADLVEAWNQYRDAVAMGSGRARDQFYIAIRWAESARDLGDLEVALEAYHRAIDLIPKVVFLGQSVVGRIEAVRQAKGLACSSANLALTLDDVASAISFLEQARGILWSQLCRSSHPATENLPEDLRAELSSAVIQEQEVLDMDWTTRRHRAERLSKIIKHIRGTPGFEQFLLPPSLSHIVELVRSRKGYACILIPAESVCDIVLLGTRNRLGFQHLRLSSVNTKRLVEMNRQFSIASSAVRSGQPVIQRKIASMSVNVPSEGNISDHILAMLWQELVSPIFSILDMKATTATTKPRMWWCPTGVMSSLPLHAAGIYTGHSQNAVSDYVISSYTPTLTTLHGILDQPTDNLNSVPSPTTSAHLLLLAGSTPSNGRSPLPNALVEVNSVHEVASDIHYMNTPGKAMSVSDALAALPEADIMHLACHGSQDQLDPLNSGFDLDDGRLTLGQLIGRKLTRAQLAYLSACECAAMDESRPDESINLAAAMLTIGFKSVVATMWSMSDMDGPFIARRVYQDIIREGCLVPSLVPVALDRAVRELRATGVSASRWATYIHLGI